MARQGLPVKRIYLSGPMSGLPGLKFPTFRSMTASLRASGHTVTNPAEINPEGGTWTDCMRRDIAPDGLRHRGHPARLGAFKGGASGSSYRGMSWQDGYERP